MTVPVPLSWILVPAGALLAYGRCLNGAPVFDDHAVLPEVGHLAWNRAHLGYQPRLLTILTLWLQSKWPNTMRGLHVGNVLGHAAVALVVERIALALGLSPAWALLAALLAAVHPFAVNTVGYVSGRASILTAFFGCLAVWAAIAGQPLLAFPALALAALSKPDGAAYVLPVAVLLSPEWAVLLLASAFVVGFAYRQPLKAYRTSAGTGDRIMRDVGLPGSLPQPEHGWTVFAETMARIPRWLFGFGGSPYHGSGMTPPNAECALFVIFILTGLAVLGRFFPIPILLILAGPWLVYLAVAVPDQLMDYRNYGMVPGFALLLASLLARLPAPFGLALTGGMVAAAASRSFDFAKAWSSPIAMWTAAIQKTSGERSRAWAEAGAHHKMEGHAVEAERYLREAVRLNPRMGPALNNLAWVVAAKGDGTEAIRLLEQCAAACPRYSLGLHDLGVFYHQAGERRKAQNMFERAFALDPKRDGSVNRLGMIAFDSGDFQEASRWFERAGTMRPDHFEYIYNRAVTLKHAGRAEEAAREFNRLPKPCPWTPEMLALAHAR